MGEEDIGGARRGDGTKIPDIFVVASSRISPSVEKQRLLAPLFSSPPAPEIRFLSSVYYTTTTHKKKREKAVMSEDDLGCALPSLEGREEQGHKHNSTHAVATM